MSPSNIKAPCLNCEDRQVGCHSNCEAYLSWTKKIKDANARKFEGWDASSYTIDRSAKFRRKREREKIK